ncbi:MAG: hypothetical protein Q8S09_07485 [Hyphomonas sp.]|nr:hypothetical protein [Hyphomonas sp.]
MPIVRMIPASLLALVSACVIAPSTTELASPAAAPEVTTVSEARLAFIAITGTLPEEGNDLPPAVLDPLMDLVPVRLDLTIRPPLAPTVQDADGFYTPITGCSFGPMEAGVISVPTGSNHMLLDVRMGSPVDHPASLFACEYDPGNISEETLGTVYRLRGCFLPQSVSIPTAVQWVLNPLPAAACGLGD